MLRALTCKQQQTHSDKSVLYCWKETWKLISCLVHLHGCFIQGRHIDTAGNEDSHWLRFKRTLDGVVS